MSSTNEGTRESVRALADGLAAMAREFEPVLKGLRELTACLEPLTRSLATAAPLLGSITAEC